MSHFHDALDAINSGADALSPEKCEKLIETMTEKLANSETAFTKRLSSMAILWVFALGVYAGVFKEASFSGLKPTDLSVALPFVAPVMAWIFYRIVSLICANGVYYAALNQLLSKHWSALAKHELEPLLLPPGPLTMERFLTRKSSGVINVIDIVWKMMLSLLCLVLPIVGIGHAVYMCVIASPLPLVVVYLAAGVATSIFARSVVLAIQYVNYTK
jgi:hypothetical protein